MGADQSAPSVNNAIVNTSSSHQDGRRAGCEETELFPFLSIPDDIKTAVVRRFSLSSTLALSMTCKSFRDKYFDKDTYENWNFIDEVCRFGFEELFYFAYEEGCPVDELDLDLLLLGNYPDLFLFLYTEFEKHNDKFNVTEQKMKEMLKIACVNGDEGVIAFLIERFVSIFRFLFNYLSSLRTHRSDPIITR